jgi:hypothetical protein
VSYDQVASRTAPWPYSGRGERRPQTARAHRTNLALKVKFLIQDGTATGGKLNPVGVDTLLEVLGLIPKRLPTKCPSMKRRM